MFHKHLKPLAMVLLSLQHWYEIQRIFKIQSAEVWDLYSSCVGSLSVCLLFFPQLIANLSFALPASVFSHVPSHFLYYGLM